MVGEFEDLKVFGERYVGELAFRHILEQEQVGRTQIPFARVSCLGRFIPSPDGKRARVGGCSGQRIRYPRQRADRAPGG